MGNREASGKQRQLAAHFDLLPVIEQSLMEDKLKKTAHGVSNSFSECLRRDARRNSSLVHLSHPLHRSLKSFD